MTVRALLAAHLPDSNVVIRRVAQHFARQLGSAALLEIDDSQATLRLFTTSQFTQPSQASRQSSSDDSKHLTQALAKLPANTDLLLVALDRSAPLLADCQQISVVACPQSQIMVAAYQQLKRLSSSRPEALGLTMVDCSSIAQGRRLAERLVQTAQEFLGLDLRVDAIVLRSARIRERKLTQIRSVDQRALAGGIKLLCEQDG